MSREIRYRAFIKSENRVCDVCSIRWSVPNGNRIKEICALDDRRWYRIEDIELCQFTGLKDRNENMIFEGDILAIIDGSVNGVKMPLPNLLVKYSYGRFNVPEWVAMELWDATHYAEVIGNVYENPSLMEGE